MSLIMDKEPDFLKIDIKIKLMDEVDCGRQSAVLADVSEIGITILTPLPLPLNSLVTIDISDNFAALAEVADWEWDVMGDLARTHLRFIEKNNNWPL
jgi:hypothetical protein